jgi:hypothetical protein
LFTHCCEAPQHAVPHMVPTQVEVQVPLLQTWPPVQALVQVPQ